MKNIYLLSLIGILIFSSCGNQKEKKNKSETDTTKIGVQETESTENKQDTNFIDKNKLLVKIIKNSTSVFDFYKTYIKALKDSNSISGNDDIFKVLKMRDSLSKLLDTKNIISKQFDLVESGKKNWDYINSLMKELNSIGISVVTVEGMYASLNTAPVLSETIEKKASEDFILAAKLKNTYGLTVGSEYPYMDLSANADVVHYGELLFTKYPNSPFIKEVKPLFLECLMPYIDFHKTSGCQENEAIIGNFMTGAYPNGTELSEHKAFIKKYPQSIFSPIIQKIIDYPSEFNDKAEHFYIVKVPAEEKNLTQLDYLLKGIDIAHELWLSKNKKAEKILAYRFFDKKNKAEEALQKIKSQVPDAEIIEYPQTKEDNTPITDKQLVKGVYSDGNIYLIVYAFEKNGDFRGVLLHKKKQFAVVGIYGSKSKKGWFFEDVNNETQKDAPLCSIDALFTKNKVTLNDPDNTYDFNSTLTKISDYNTPKAGNYGELRISKVNDYSINFIVSTGNSSGSCTGEIPDEKGTAVAYGINGVYVYNNYDSEAEYGCLILITCKDNTINFSEIGDCAFHGAMCSFNGSYTLQ